MRRTILSTILLVLLVAPAYAGDFTNETVSIASGATDSTELDTNGRLLYLIELPAAFTGTALTFKCAAASGGTFKAIYSNGTLVTITVAQNRMESTSTIAGSLAACRFLKVVSGSSEGGTRSIVLLLKD